MSEDEDESRVAYLIEHLRLRGVLPREGEDALAIDAALAARDYEALDEILGKLDM